MITRVVLFPHPPNNRTGVGGYLYVQTAPKSGRVFHQHYTYNNNNNNIINRRRRCRIRWSASADKFKESKSGEKKNNNLIARGGLRAAVTAYYIILLYIYILLLLCTRLYITILYIYAPYNMRALIDMGPRAPIHCVGRRRKQCARLSVRRRDIIIKLIIHTAAAVGRVFCGGSRSQKNEDATDTARTHRGWKSFVVDTYIMIILIL